MRAKETWRRRPRSQVWAGKWRPEGSWHGEQGNEQDLRPDLQKPCQNCVSEQHAIPKSVDWEQSHKKERQPSQESTWREAQKRFVSHSLSISLPICRLWIHLYNPLKNGNKTYRTNSFVRPNHWKKTQDKIKFGLYYPTLEVSIILRNFVTSPSDCMDWSAMILLS